MEGPRATRKEEFKDVIGLINDVFRISRNYKPTMKEEFPLLLNENNIDNMRILLEGGKPISVVSFLHEDIFIGGSKINAASIGGVCTAYEYRGNGYSSLILDDVESKMKKEKVDIVLISGTRSLYTRRNCIMLQNFYKCVSYPSNIDSINIVEYEERYIEEMIEAYESQHTRYYRSKEEFKTLLHSATIPWGNFTYNKYVILENDNFAGYIVIRTIAGEVKYGQVIEALGDEKLITRALERLAFDLKLEKIYSYVHIKEDYANRFENKKIDYLEGTIKIINFVSFMENLRGYFEKSIPKYIVDSLKFSEKNGKYIFMIEDEILEVDNLEKVTKLIFEGKKEGIGGIKHVPLIGKFVDLVFPIPFVWTANLNYQ